MSNNLTQGRKIKIMRTVRGFTQGELAKEVELTPQMLSCFENDHAIPSNASLKKIKAALSWPSDDQAEAAFAILIGNGDKR